MPEPEQIEEGQFDDAPEDISADRTSVPQTDRPNGQYIDEENLLEWSETSEEEEDEDELEEDQLEAEAFETLRAEDEDWEIAERDFTKQYNRLRQHVAVRTGAASGVASTVGRNAAVAPLPAVNRPRPTKTVTPGSTIDQHAKNKTENQLQALSKYSSRLRNLDMPYDLGVGVNRKGPSATANMKDKSDRATSEQVLDPRTRIILFKMIGRGLLFEVNGCVSTGKEANVYHALTPEKRHLALKIYKTSILVFKDRDRYVSGEFRFRKGYSRHNPRKMVRVWAEKEMRNLKRLYTAGIRCPEPIEVRENVLVMSFIGDKDGWASPRMKDADIPPSAHADLYVELVTMVRKMFHECKLVHADLSEYNILYHVEDAPSPSPSAEVSKETTDHEESERRGHLYIIDVSQSVEHDHPHAFDFLRADIKNIDEFFARRGVKTLGLRRTFEFITIPTPPGTEQSSDDERLRKMIDELTDGADEEGEGNAQGEGRKENAHEDEVFMRSYIPRTLNEVYDPERDVGVLTKGEGEKLIYKDTIGIVAPATKEQQEKKGVRFEENGNGEESNEEDSEDEEGDEEEESEGEEGKDEFKERKPRGHRHEDKDAKKVCLHSTHFRMAVFTEIRTSQERKKAAKEEAREKRKHKMPKAEKKRKIKQSARSK
ncbi:RIO1-domain-containing protein [Panus rudis PR-1116 ss-1]|nr:RIO1-domain-containing protein [Panus rudis PR-1116 ss-1]